jgi:anti-anti-sigma regulatory factor
MAKKTTVSLGVALDIMHVSALKNRLASAMAKGLPVVLISDKVEKADSAGLQLMYSFKQKMKQKQLDLIWKKPSESLLQACELLGMTGSLMTEEEQ